ncbi:MAG TPA: DUF896 domain-containing protein [Methylomusa anaerophila]|uniref:UPF0291 protein MAMMFC1_03354 n=1 Tax=Methylomusa anaerophila TaxID=1930071 RepID=A0A348ANL1_9FIRM|nr:DUF896 domain-containing protein [Methylomusa anaerophila]BBB92659.1 hypothetical protein MAMMFC1_03354 [Methylomusa anaerophila]HML87488.1 DUF896 domain-containing protein [Methylomusa anaerophila]
MITPEVIARINELARKSRESCLTEEERTEQSHLRRLYIDHIKAQVKASLDCIEIQDQHSPDCDCGCKKDPQKH